MQMVCIVESITGVAGGSIPPKNVTIPLQNAAPLPFLHLGCRGGGSAHVHFLACLTCHHSLIVSSFFYKELKLVMLFAIPQNEKTFAL